MPEQDALIGQTMGEFEIVELIGVGGMGKVYLARQTSLGRQVAVKVLPKQIMQEEAAIERFRREAMLAAQLTHPNIAQVYTIGTQGDVHYVAMELIRGGDVATMLRGRGRISVEEAAPIIRQALLGVASAHAEGIIHRDLKPQNLMVSAHGVVKVTDFGLARAVASDSSLTASGAVLGTPLYMSPEQAEGKKVDARTDIYALGATLYHMVCGRPPFQGETPLSTLLKHLTEPLPSPRELDPDIPEPLCDIISKMMGKRLEERYQSCEEVLADLGAYCEGGAASPVRATSATIPPEAAQADMDAATSPAQSYGQRTTWRDGVAAAQAERDALTTASKPRSRKRIALAVVAIAVVCVLSVLFVLSKRGSEPPPDQSTAETPATPAKPAIEREKREPAPSATHENLLGVKFVRIPAGEFMMGSTDAHAKVVAAGRRDREKLKERVAWEQPQHKVRISREFLMGKYEVTVGQFRRFTEASGYKTVSEEVGGTVTLTKGQWRHIKGVDWRSPYFEQTDDHPVVCICYEDAIAFCKWLNEADSQKPEGHEYRLPTEAEWEYAARGREGHIYPWGDDWPTAQAKCNFLRDAGDPDDGFNQSAPIGSFSPAGDSPFGVANLAGNAYEWCLDSFETDWYAKTPTDDPLNTEHTGYYVIRGGSWLSYQAGCRTTNRGSNMSKFRFNGTGFRVVLAPMRAGPPPAVKPMDTAALDGHFYKLFPEPFTWDAAKQFCERLGGHLVTISSAKENDLVSTLARQADRNVWLGLSQAGRDRWEWVTGEPFAFKDWGRGEPNNQARPNNRAAINPDHDFHWGDARTDVELHVVCEWEPGGGHPPSDRSVGSVRSVGWPFPVEEAKRRQQETARALGLPVEQTIKLPGGQQMSFVLIPAGEFEMGSTEQEIAAEIAKYPRDKIIREEVQTEAPRHRVRITRPFYLGKHEVTQAQWEAVTGDNPSQRRDDPDGPRLPVESISWDDVHTAFLPQLHQKAGVHIGREFRLPTEAEWEYACRAGAGTRFFFGDDETLLKDYAWYPGNCQNGPNPVGAKKPNAWSLHDMSGNVFEWCEDRWDAGYYRKSPTANPRNTTGDACVYRGGTWDHVPFWCRPAARTCSKHSAKYANVGFRFVLLIPARYLVVPGKPTVYAAWPFDSREAELRQQETAAALGLPGVKVIECANDVGIKLHLVPAGEFLMGSTEERINALVKRYPKEAWIRAELPQHRVRITRPFYLSKHEIRQEQWRKLVGDNPSKFKDKPDADWLPVEQVSWNDVAQKFMPKVQAALPAGWRARFPTEAQWEWACRAGASTNFYFDDHYRQLADHAWYGRQGGDTTKRVGRKQPNAWGLRDMHGNVYEWCGDRYDENYYKASPVDDPCNSSKGAERVVRGGCWWDGELNARSSSRDCLPQDKRAEVAGVRLLVQPSPDTLQAFLPPGLRRDRTAYANSLGMKFVKIPAGEFRMGSTGDEMKELLAKHQNHKWLHEQEKSQVPKHRVRITRSLLMGMYEVTQAQYQTLTGRNPSDSKGDQQPVETVSWHEAKAFCFRLNLRDKTRPPGLWYRLPTEAEREYACRAGATTHYFFGNGEEGADEYAWHGGNAGGQRYEVGQKEPNRWGLYDINGNVWEWCEDAYAPDYYAQSSAHDPLSREGESRVLRGGGSNVAPVFFCLASYRHHSKPDGKFDDVGFRVVLAPRRPMAQPATPTDGLVLHLPFDGNAEDQSGSGRDGQVHGTQLTADRFGIANSAYSFAGEGQHIRVPPVPRRLNEPMSISVWAKFAPGHLGKEFGNAIICQDSKDKQTGRETRLWQLCLEQDRIAWHLMGEIEDDPKAPTPVDSYRWYHVVVVFDGQRHQIYVDGLWAAAVKRGMPAGEAPIFIGRKDWWVEERLNMPLMGAVDDARIYSRALTVPEVYALYHEGDYRVGEGRVVLRKDAQGFGGHFYSVITTPGGLAWHDAKRRAEEVGGYLACIGAKEENTFLTGLAGGQQLWIGLSDVDKEGDWRWANGSPAKFQNWEKGQPDSARIQQGVTIRKGGLWGDDHFPMDFLCEWESKQFPRATAEFGGHHYKVFWERRTWQEAKKRCEELGGHLACVQSREENDFLTKLTEGKGVWLGGTDEAKEGEWRWVTGAKPTYANWGPTQPNNGGRLGRQHYLWMSYRRLDDAEKHIGQWDDLFDDGLGLVHGFVCEWE